jgi:AraC-like DNA-binding protein
MNYTYIYAIGAAQGLVLAIALWLKKSNKRSNRVMVAWLLCLVFDLTIKAVYRNTHQDYLLPFYTFAHFLPFLYGSFFYLYVKTIAFKHAIVWADLVHFLGFIFMVAVNLHWIFNPWNNYPRNWFSFDLSLYLYSVSYVLAGLFVIKKYRQSLEQQQSNTDGISLVWIDVMAYSQVVIWLIAVTQWLIPIESYDVWVIYVAVSVYMIAMGYLALIQQNVEPLVLIAATESLNDERFPEVDEKLKTLMEQQQLYLDPTLNIGQLAKKAGYPEYLVSLLINQKYQQTFREYINQLRVGAATSMLQDFKNTNTILDIAYASGFTSKSTFNSAFKKMVNKTPSQFRTAQRLENEGDG